MNTSSSPPTSMAQPHVSTGLWRAAPLVLIVGLIGLVHILASTAQVSAQTAQTVRVTKEHKNKDMDNWHNDNEADSEADLDDCTRISYNLHAPVGVLFKPQKGKRYTTSNHKTGTLFSLCLKRVLKEFDMKTEEGSRKVAGGYSPTSFQTNMVRNPFVVVHSAYEYHKSVPKPEPWTLAPLTDKSLNLVLLDSSHITQYNAWCNDTKTAVNITMSYRETLNYLPFKQGLVLEIIRSRGAIADMLAASMSCRQAHVEADKHTGACINIPLDEVMANYTAAFGKYFVPALGLYSIPRKAAGRFAQICDPATATDTRTTEHSTDEAHRGLERERAVMLIRELDRSIFGGRLREAEVALDFLIAETAP